MSKRDRSQLADMPEFREVQRECVENKALVTPQKSKKTVHDPDDNEDDSPSFFHQTGTLFVKCWHKAVTFSKSAASHTWRWCRSTAQWTWSRTWSGLRKISSYCVIRWDSENETEPTVSETVTYKMADPQTVAPKTVDSKTADSKPKIEPVKVRSVQANAVPATEQFDEDELTPSRWWNLGIKSAAVAVAVLILVGGYYAVKSFTSPKVSADVATDTETHDSTESSPPNATVAAVIEPSSEPESANPAIPPVVAPPAPSAASGIIPEPPQELRRELPQNMNGELARLDNDPFFNSAKSALPTPSAAAAQDPFGSQATAVADIPFAESAPGKFAAASPLPQTLSALQPLEPVPSVAVQPQLLPQLQPLAALDVPASSLSAPVAAEAPVSAPVASKYAPRKQSRGTKTDMPFDSAPTPPAVTNTIPQTVIEQTIPITKPIKEIVPRIPHSGTVQDVPPVAVPAAMPTTVAANPSALATSSPSYETPPVHAMPSNESYVNETVPAIPKDAPTAANSRVIAVQPLPQNALAGSPPIDNRLWNQLRELQNDTETHLGQAEPTKLQFGTASESAEPALRFTPKQASPQAAAPVADNGNLLKSDTNNAFKDWISDDLSPNSKDIETTLISLEKAPGPAYAEVRPKYREDSAKPANSEGGITFRNRQTEMRRSAIRYTVQEGDTVFRLATDKLKDSTRWREILAMNEDRLHDVRDLKPGMEILLPVEAARQNRQTY